MGDIKRKSIILRELFKKPGIIRIIGAHNGLTARLVERAGFEGIWASSLEISASHAVPDANILTMTDYLNAAIDINDATSLPVVADCDTGYGTSTNVMHLVRKFENAGIAGICIEDKMFPKQNSLLQNGRQELASIAEFVGKIMAAKNAQRTKDFMVITRIEALIAGWGQEEAMKRAKAYAKAGADAILIHSKSKDPKEIIEFVEKWDLETPLVIVPTNYYTLTEEQIKKYPKIKMVIYANQGIRASVKAITETLNEIKKTGGIKTITPKITPVDEIFELQGTFEMKKHEKKFLKTGKEPIKAIIPAAGIPLDETLKTTVLRDTPVCMLDINGKPLLQRHVELLNSLGINDVNVIIGYSSNKINVENINRIENKNYKTTGLLDSIMCAENHMNEKTLLIYSDILFDKEIIDRLIKRNDDVVLVVDPSYKNMDSREKVLDLVITKKSPSEGERSLRIDNEVLKIGQDIPKDKAHFEFIGIAMFSKKGINLLKKYYKEIKDKKEIKDADFTYLIQKMIDSGSKVSCLEVNKGWTELHTFEDYKRVSSTLI